MERRVVQTTRLGGVGKCRGGCGVGSVRGCVGGRGSVFAHAACGWAP